MQLKIIRRSRLGVIVASSIATTIPTGISKQAALQMLVAASAGWLALEEVPGVITFYRLPSFGELDKVNSYTYPTQAGVQT